MNDISTKELMVRVGGLSSPSKMPCYGYSVPAKECETGGTLRKVPGSVCNKCYAIRGNYNWPSIQKSLYRRLEIMMTDPMWVANMSELLNRLDMNYFRWFDSGDVHSIKNVENIATIGRNTPTVKHWFPTKEYKYVTPYIDSGKTFPPNMTVRLSAYMIDGPAPVALAKRLGVTYSGVTKTPNFTCPAPTQGNECRSCRKCWDKNDNDIVYKYH